MAPSTITQCAGNDDDVVLSAQRHRSRHLESNLAVHSHDTDTHRREPLPSIARMRLKRARIRIREALTDVEQRAVFAFRYHMCTSAR